MQTLLIARIGKNNIAIDIKYIHFIIRNNGIVKLPHMPDWMEGIISYRDRVIPVFNNKQKFGFENDSGERKRIILVEAQENTLFGINIDQYFGIEKANENGTTLKLKDNLVSVIDVEKLIDDKEVEFAKKL